jgi:hypothetical protein
MLFPQQNRGSQDGLMISGLQEKQPAPRQSFIMDRAILFPKILFFAGQRITA